MIPYLSELFELCQGTVPVYIFYNLNIKLLDSRDTQPDYLSYGSSSKRRCCTGPVAYLDENSLNEYAGIG